ncbi:SIS domain-containing protein [Pseudobacillus sp. FSL P4-0506]|uniref:SIS domain-containing protein n=1 Tax=unclassified Pseudobacillus TaxID=2619284 RepID=UPI0030FA3B71
MFLAYMEKVAHLLQETAQKQADSAQQAAHTIASSIKNGGIIHVFGCGHSHMLAEELFYRAGGLACINPIFIEELMLHKDAVRSSSLEQEQNFAFSFMKDIPIQQGDVFIAVSTSGINPVPIDALLYAKKKGAETLALTSLAYSEQASSRHKEGIKLFEVADLVIDNGAPYGDAILAHPHADAEFAPVSTVMGAALLNGIMAEVISILADNNYKPPIFKSSNAGDSKEHNHSLIQRYSPVIKLFEN